MSIHLRQALTAAIKIELYPRSQIDVYVEVLQVQLVQVFHKPYLHEYELNFR